MRKITQWVKIIIICFLFGFTTQLYSFNSPRNNFNENYGDGICYVFSEAPEIDPSGFNNWNGDFNSTSKSAEISITISETPATCSNKADGSLTATVSGGISSYIFDWTGPNNFSASGATINNLKPGSYTVRVNDTDNAEQSKTTTLSFIDSQNPTALAKDITIQLDANGNATIDASDIDNGSSDNCGVKALSIDKTNFNCANVGSNTVTLTVTDINGNTVSNTATVTVKDVNPPNVITQNITVQLDASGNATIAEDAVNNDSSDACGTLSFDTDINSFDCSNVGANTVKLIATDGNGNSAVNTATVTVLDKIVPIVITKPITVQLDANGQVSISPEDVNNGSSDNCSIDRFTLNKSNFSCSEVGENTVILTIIDVNGNTNTANAVVTVEDKEKPIIAAVTAIYGNNDLGLCRTNISITPPTASDNCSLNAVIGSREGGLALNEPYPIGSTFITWNVSDKHGNVAESVTQEVIVIDNEAPVPPEMENITWGCEYTLEIPIASDNCDEEITGVPNRSLTFTTSGNITWTFTDNKGNSSSATQNIIIDPLSLNENNITIIDVLCNGLATGEAEVQATGGVTPLTYDWGSLGIGSKKTNLPAGTYNVKVSDANGCEVGPISVTIKEPDTFIEITSTTSTSGCFGANNGTAKVEAKGGTGAYTYLWQNGQTSQTASGLAPGTYSVKVTDANGCFKDRTITVSSPTLLQITGFLTTETTSFGSATGSATAQVAGGSGKYTFLWSNGQIEQTATSLLAGEHTVTVTDANGCSTTDHVVVVDSIEAEIVPTSVCEGSEDIIRTSYFKVDESTLRGGTAPYTFDWDFGNGNGLQANIGRGPHRISYGEIGEKEIVMIVKDVNGLEFQQRIIQYVGGCFSDDCGSSDLGIDDYYIGDEGGTPITTNNCSTTDSKFIYIYIPTNPDRYSLNVELIYSIENIETREIRNFKEVGCFYEKEVIPDRAQTFQIEYTCGNIVKIEGIYLTFSNKKSDNCGEGNKPKCYSTNNNATVNSPLYAVAFPNELLCNGASNGRISVRASGGISPYLYKLVNAADNAVVRVNQPSEIFENLAAGLYDVIVTDSKNPKNTFIVENVEITEPTNPLIFQESSITNVVCYGGENGSATVSATGGTPNSTGEKYIYVWSNGQTGPTATNLIAGEYTVTVNDANGCQVETIITIDQPDELLADAGPDQVLGCGVNSTNLAAVFQIDETSTEEQSGTWTIINGPAGGSFADPNDPTTKFLGNQGTYTLRWSVTCGKTDDVKITFKSCSTLDFDGQDDHINMGANYDLGSGNFSLETWIKPKSIDGVRTIISKRNYNDIAAGGYDFVINNGTPQFRYGSKTFASTGTINTKRWFHIAVIKNNSEIKFFIDGIEVGSATGAVNPASSDAPLIVGAIYDAVTPNITKNQFHGWMEELRIWNKPITAEQLRFMMNQRIEDNGNVRGEIIPLDVPGALQWTELEGYYRLIVSEISGGITVDRAQNKIDGKLINITTSQENTAPLPYVSRQNGSWRTTNTWLRPTVWDVPNAKGVNNEPINWNIVKSGHTVYSNNTDISLLGFVSETGTLELEGVNQTRNSNGTGNPLTITHYLKLDGNINLKGESQLIQTDIKTANEITYPLLEFPQSIVSELDETSIGFIIKEQQGTASSYNYNYWSSPVSLQKTANNSGYTVKGVMMDGSSTNNFGKPISFGNPHTYADDAFQTPRKVSNYWVNAFRARTADAYSAWEQIGSEVKLKPGEGYTMKGTSGNAAISDLQNYVFKGKPNNGTITLNIGKDQNYLIGNPYPSALNVDEFFKDNLKDINGGRNTENSFNGALYFWDHFSGKTHNLAEYVGGYAVLNLVGAVAAIATDERIDATGAKSSRRPGSFIPVAQGFFINTEINPNAGAELLGDGGIIKFKNSQRIFIPETSSSSQFLKPEKPKTKGSKENSKIRLDFSSPLGYHRQILVGTSEYATNGFDIGYDAPLNDYSEEDFFWLINNYEYVIQGVANFNPEQILPVGMYISQKGEITLEINELENIPDDTTIYLKDLETKIYHDLRKSEFKIELEPGTYYERFQIVFSIPEVDPDNPDEGTDGEPDPDGDGEGTVDPTDKPDVLTNLDVVYASKNRELTIINPDNLKIRKVTIYNLLGQKVQEYEQMENNKLMPLKVKEFPTAVYVVKMYSEKGEMSKNIVLMK